MSGVLDRAKAHYKALPTNEILVPEWGENGKPLKVTWSALTVGSRRRIYNKKNGDPVDGGTALLRAVMLKACDEQGNRLFSEMDENDLESEVDGSIVSRIGAAILGLELTATVEEQIEMEKNA